MSDYEKFEAIKQHLQQVINILQTPFNNLDPSLTKARVEEVKRYLEEINDLLDTFDEN